MNIPESAVEAAAKAIAFQHWRTAIDDARAALEAAAPMLMAQALRNAANMLDTAPATDTRDALEAEVRQIKMLRARANELEGK